MFCQAKTAIELWNDGVEGRLNLQLYRCDLDSLLQEPQGGKTSPEILSRFYSACYEQESYDDNRADVWMPGFLDSDSSDEEEDSEDVNLEGRVTPPLRLFDHLESPTYEELLKQNWELFDGSDQEPECSTLKDVPEELELLDSPEGALKCCSLIDHPVISVVPEPACATEAAEMNPPIKRGPKKRKKNNWGRQKRRPPRTTAVMMVSVDENADEIECNFEDPGGLAGCKGFQDSCQLKQTVAQSGSSHHKVLEQGLPWESLLGTPTSPRIAPAPPIPASELFAEHLSQYNKALFYSSVLILRHV